jgi:lipopolysaccharide/colanic/teichoic acid biosynthesis glycosyltransferase
MLSNTLAKPQLPRGTETSEAPEDLFLEQKPFLRMIQLERMRSERSGRRFVLMLLDTGSLLRTRGKQEVLDNILETLLSSTRVTDIKGWYETGSVIGVIFTELGSAQGRPAAGALLAKITAALGGALSIEQINEIRLSFHVFPEDWEAHGPDGPAASALYPDLRRSNPPKSADLHLKRAIDICGSLAALILLSPVLAVIALAVKLTSRGPALFRQQRVGRYGKRFTFLKFRSMYLNCDSRIHEEYITRFISSTDSTGQEVRTRATVLKLTADPRVTPLGKFLRKTSLDELPQFWNVLKGDMSLVGPRPPIPYEFQRYHTWHKRRMLEVKPGITGLWQVEGRSRVPFDEMVRMDLRYARSRSVWMDLRILLQTPAAVLSGNGAY